MQTQKNQRYGYIKLVHWVHDLWKNIKITFTTFNSHFLHYLDMKRNYVDDSLKVRILTV